MAEQQAVLERKLQNLLEEQAAQHEQERTTLQKRLWEIERQSEEKRRALRVSADRSARRWVFAGSIATGLVFAAVGIEVLPLVVSRWDLIEPYSFVIEKVGGACLGVAGMANPCHLKDRIRDRLASWIFRRRSVLLLELEEADGDTRSQAATETSVLPCLSRTICEPPSEEQGGLVPVSESPRHRDEVSTAG